MANYTSIELGSGVAGARTYPVSGVGLGGRTYHSARGEYTTTVAIGAGDTVQMFDLPPRARIHSAYIKADQLDSNGSPTITTSMGITGTAGLFFSASTSVGRTAGASADTAMLPAARDFLTTGKTRVFLTFPAAAATGVVGAKIVVHVAYSVEEPA